MSDGDPVTPELERLVAEVADEFRARIARGESADPSEFAARHPAAAELIRAVLQSLRLAPVLADKSEPPAALRGTLGDFRIIREVGRGGMGVVYEAEQISLGRRVALKVLPFAALADARLLQRFKNEARAAAALDHPHIVKVHAVGEDRGVHFIAMQFIDGRPLADLIGELHGTIPPGPGAVTAAVADAPALGDTERSLPAARQSTLPDARTPPFFHRAAELGIQAALALEHAHALGVVHRDIKPGNLMVDSTGTLWVSDFGLAKITTADAGVTMTGDVFGTLRYMSPEQALAKHDLVDHRTDVYALGATLYELFCGRPAVDGKDKAEILRKITDSEPIPLRKLNRAVPADLETVVLKCLRKEPNDRYASAKDLADDLRRFSRGEPVRAKPVGPVGRWHRWVARHPGPVLLVGLTGLATIAAITLGVRAHYGAKADRAALQIATEQEERQRFFALLERVRQRRADPYPGWSPENLTDLRELARMGPAAQALHDLRSEAASTLTAFELIPAGTLCPDFPVCGLDYSPDGRWLAAGRWAPAPSDPTRVRLYGAVSGEVIRDLVIPPDADAARWEAESGMQDRVQTVRFSPDGRWLTAGTGSGRLAVWDTHALTAGPRVWTAHTDRTTDTWRPGWHHTMVDSIAFTPDSKTFRSGTRSGFRAWFPDGQPAGPPITGFRLPASLPPSAGRVPAVREKEGDLQVLDLGTGQVVPGTRRQGGAPLAVDPGGRLVAFMPRHAEGPPLFQAVEPGSPPRPLWSPTGAPVEMPVVEHLAFNPGGGLLVSVEESPPRLKLWDAATARLVAEQTPPMEVVRTAFRPDGGRLAVGGRKGVALFDLPNCVLQTVGAVAEPAVESMAAPPDHQELWVISREVRGSGPTAPDRVYRQDLGSAGSSALREALELRNYWSILPVAEWWPAGRVAAYGRRQSSIPDIFGTTAEPFWEVRADHLKAARFGPGGQLWILDDEGLRKAVPPAGAARVVWRNDLDWAPRGLQLRSLAAGGRWVFVGRRDGMVIRIDPATGAPTEWHLLSTPADGLALSPDETRLLVGGEGGEVRLVDVETGTVTVAPDAHRADVPAVAFGRHFFVTGSADRRVRLWTPDGQPLATLRMSGPVRKLLLSDDERSLLVLVEGERAVRRWRLDELFKEWKKLGLADDLLLP